MSDNRFKVNHKEQRAITGNWGHPRKFVKKLTKIPDPIYPELNYIDSDNPSGDYTVDFVTKKKIKRYKKKVKKPYVYPNSVCPFCKQELAELPKEINSSDRFTIFTRREIICRNCGAKKVDNCPCCHHDTWLLDKIYKHQDSWCGFEGEKR